MKPQNDILRRIETYKNLPSLPEILGRLCDACNDEETTSHELSRIISIDPSLSARIMHMANCPCMGRRQCVTSVAKAVARLGEDTITNLAVTTLVLQGFNHLRWNSLINLTRFWRQSLMCASLARKLAEKTSYPCPEEAFLSGLLHDIGKLVLLVNFTREYAAILRDAVPDSELLVAERDKTGMTHCEAGAWLIRRWSPKSLMADAVLYQHEATERIVDSFALVKIVHVSNALCQADLDTLGTGIDIARAVFGLSPSQVEDMVGGANQEVIGVAQWLNIPIKATAFQEVVAPEKMGEESKDFLPQARDISSLCGTLQNLLKAHSRKAILQIVARSLHILFEVEKVFFFICVAERDLLVGISPTKDDDGESVAGLEIDIRNERSLIARSLAKRAVLDSFDYLRPEAMTIAEEQMIRLAGTEGILCLPMLARGQNVGVIVAGVGEHQCRGLTEQPTLLNMFAKHVAISLQVEETRQERTRMLESERLDAGATIAREVGHEVNNRLGIMKNYIKILSMKLPEEDSALNELKIIGEEIDRVGHIVERLSDFSHPKKGEYGPVSLETLFSRLLKILHVSILHPKNIETHLSLDPTVPEIVTNEEGLKQVLINLIKNAAEAMPDGGNIYLRTERVDDSEKLGIADIDKGLGCLEITVSDDGPGIPDYVKARLFEPYNTSKGADHSGLGLSIVHSIIKELSGSISCESAEYKGTTFSILLPLS